MTLFYLILKSLKCKLQFWLISKGYRSAKKSAVKINSTSANFKMFTCEVCGQNFQQNRYLQEHIKLYFPEFVKCTICNKEFISKTRMYHHMKKVHEGKISKCYQCHYTSKQKQNLERHIFSTHEDVKFIQLSNFLHWNLKKCCLSLCNQYSEISVHYLTNHITSINIQHGHRNHRWSSVLLDHKWFYIFWIAS